MDPSGSEGSQECIFSILTHTKQLLLVISSYMTVEIGSVAGRDRKGWYRMDGRMEGQADAKVQIVMYIRSEADTPKSILGMITCG